MKSSQKSCKQSCIIWCSIIFGYALTTYLVLNYPPHQTDDYIKDLRKANDNFDWTLLPVILCVLNFYFEEIRQDRWNIFFAGIGFLTMDCYNEIWNALLYKYTNNFAAPWICNFRSSYFILVGCYYYYQIIKKGWNIEIVLTFLLVGLFAQKILPKNKNFKIQGINNRHAISIILSIVCVLFELMLNHYRALIWEFSFWNASCPYLIFLIGYLPFFEVCYYIHDLPTFKAQLQFILSFSGLAFSILFGCIYSGLI